MEKPEGYHQLDWKQLKQMELKYPYGCTCGEDHEHTCKGTCWYEAYDASNKYQFQRKQNNIKEK